MNYNEYEPTAWKGEIPESLDIIDDEKQPLSKKDMPPAILETFSNITGWILIIGYLGASLTFFVAIAGLFLNGLNWSYIQEDPVTIYVLVIFSFFIVLILASLPYSLFFAHKYGRYINNNFKFSSLFNETLYTQLPYPKEFPLLPFKMFNLKYIRPKDWKQYRRYMFPNFTWDETCLTHYKFHQKTRYTLLRTINYFNLAILLFYFPITILQYFFDAIYLPVYLPLMLLSVSLFIVTRFTNKIGKVYADIILNRRDGYITFNSVQQQEWKCHFSEINAYIEQFHTRRSGKKMHCLMLAPRAPLKGSRTQLSLQYGWSQHSTEDVTKLWQVISQFMNVTLPLPFVVPLEDVRDKDPTTQKTPVKNSQLVNLQSLEYEEYKALLEDSVHLKLDIDD